MIAVHSFTTFPSTTLNDICKLAIWLHEMAIKMTFIYGNLTISNKGDKWNNTRLLGNNVLEINYRNNSNEQKVINNKTKQNKN